MQTQVMATSEQLRAKVTPQWGRNKRTMLCRYCKKPTEALYTSPGNIGTGLRYCRPCDVVYRIMLEGVPVVSMNIRRASKARKYIRSDNVEMIE